MNHCLGSASSAKHWVTPLLHAIKLSVTSAKRVLHHLLLPLDALIPQLTLKQLKNSQPGRKFKVNQQWTQWLLRQLWLLTRVQVVLYVSGKSWLYKQDPLMLLLALLKSFRYLKIALQLPQHRLQGGNT
jgi:hypothetical protein